MTELFLTWLKLIYRNWSNGNWVGPFWIESSDRIKSLRSFVQIIDIDPLYNKAYSLLN